MANPDANCALCGGVYRHKDGCTGIAAQAGDFDPAPKYEYSPDGKTVKWTNRDRMPKVAAQAGDEPMLLPCPFCGNSDAFVERLDYSAAYVQCDGDVGHGCACLARGPVAVQDDDGEEIPGGAGAIAAWNNRAEVALPADRVQVPQNAQQAHAMFRLAQMWLTEHEPQNVSPRATADVEREGATALLRELLNMQDIAETYASGAMVSDEFQDFRDRVDNFLATTKPGA